MTYKIEGPFDASYFLQKLPEILAVYREAFSGAPWFLSISPVTAYSRISNHINRNEFTAFIAREENGEIVGVVWFYSPTPEELETDEGPDLKEFAERILRENKIRKIVWEREIHVRPKYQGQHIATKLRKMMLSFLASKYPEGVLLFTRMREDNAAVIKVAEKVGFQRTGIRVSSTSKLNVQHEYWYQKLK